MAQGNRNSNRWWVSSDASATTIQERNKNMNRVMLDIETLSIKPNAVVTQIGACKFDINEGVMDTFERNLKLQDQIDKGRVIDESTLTWWMGKANKASWLDDQMNVFGTLMTFIRFIHDADEVWCHTTFDYVIMNTLLKDYGLDTIHHYMPRDIRTVTSDAGMSRDDWKIYMETNHGQLTKSHSALDDCIYQVGYVSECLRRLHAKS